MSAPRDKRPAGGEPTFHLFVYGTLRRDGGAADRVLPGCEWVGEAKVAGALYDLGDYPALVLAGHGTVHGEIWRCPACRLAELDAYERADAGLFRRVGARIAGLPCWTYVAGPAIAARLTHARRIRGGRWHPSPAPAAGR